MRKRIRILMLALVILVCRPALGEETVYHAFGDLFMTEEMTEGFSVPVPADENAFRFRPGDGHYMTCRSTDASAPNRIYIDYYVFDPLSEFAENQETAEAIYAEQHYEKNREYQSKNISIDGHIARICTFRGKTETGEQSVGILHYARNNRMMQIRVYSEPQNGTSWDELPKVTPDDMKKLAGMVQYDSAKASATAEEGTFSVFVKGGSNTLSAGNTVRMNAVFDNPDKVNKELKNNKVKWSVRDTETGKTPGDILISQKGELSADRKITDVQQVTVRAESTVYHTTAETQVTVLPMMSGLSLEPADIRLYTGEKNPVTVQAIPEPKSVPPTGLTWTAVQRGIVEIAVNEEDGTAGILPVKAGNAVVMVKEPGGKTAKLNVSVMQSVEDILLNVNGTARPGSQVTVKATIMPRNLWDRKVDWSLDVDEKTAKIDRGTVRIGKDVPEGTVITVTCTAEDAPEPVVRTIQLEVKKQ